MTRRRPAPFSKISAAEYREQSPGLEDTFHESVAQYLDAVLHPSVLWTTFPAGGGGELRGAALKRKGLKPGWPDVQILWDAGLSCVSHFVGIELKELHHGRLSAEQIVMHKRIHAAGGRVHCARTVNDVERILTVEQIPLRDRIVRRV